MPGFGGRFDELFHACAFFMWRANCGYQLHYLGQVQSTVAQRAETTDCKYFVVIIPPFQCVIINSLGRNLHFIRKYLVMNRSRGPRAVISGRLEATIRRRSRNAAESLQQCSVMSETVHGIINSRSQRVRNLSAAPIGRLLVMTSSECG